MPLIDPGDKAACPHPIRMVRIAKRALKQQLFGTRSQIASDNHKERPQPDQRRWNPEARTDTEQVHAKIDRVADEPKWAARCQSVPQIDLCTEAPRSECQTRPAHEGASDEDQKPAHGPLKCRHVRHTNAKHGTFNARVQQGEGDHVNANEQFSSRCAEGRAAGHVLFWQRIAWGPPIPVPSGKMASREEKPEGRMRQVNAKIEMPHIAAWRRAAEQGIKPRPVRVPHARLSEIRTPIRQTACQ